MVAMWGSLRALMWVDWAGLIEAIDGARIDAGWINGGYAKECVALVVGAFGSTR